ncbi:MAG TPA: UdgX family uracil-DNA binding protein [Burkholderiaceae bacterium]|nr:UdgX family uracil-DNA binding protein [Burkholderiaceae bacterium]
MSASEPENTSPRSCRRCDLWRNATQAVLGEGPRRARLMLVGEQPGDAEDLQGHPFVGSAGQLLDRMLHEAGIDRAQVFVTNAVKHFKWEPRGKRRIHKTPAQREIDACRLWLDEEIGSVRPDVIVAMGATAVKSVLGPAAGTIDSLRRRDDLEREGARVVVTYHPSALLRAPTPELRRKLQRAFADDLSRAVEAGAAARDR